MISHSSSADYKLPQAHYPLSKRVVRVQGSIGPITVQYSTHKRGEEGSFEEGGGGYKGL